MARARKPQTEKAGEFTCPECGRTFTRAAALGAHRRQAHGVAGASRRSSPRTTRPSASASRTGARTQRRRTRTTPMTRTAPSSGSRSGRSRSRTDRAVDRDALLQTLFPDGIPAKESVIRSLNSWLDEAERLARMR
jgi:Zinc finger, C2H2 type